MAGAGSGTVNTIRGSTKSRVLRSATKKASRIGVKAEDNAEITAYAGAASIAWVSAIGSESQGRAVSVGAAVAINELHHRDTVAEVSESSLVADGAVDV